MGFGFSVLFMLVLLPVTAVYLIAWLRTRQKAIGRSLGFIWLGFIGLLAGLSLLRRLNEKVVLDREDYNGQYVVDRRFFPGRQADWQYHHFRFEIRANDSLYFYVTEGEQVLQVYRAGIATLQPYRSAQLAVCPELPTHHILSGQPTIYRTVWSFYLVFHSARFGNVFFRKGNWKAAGW